MKLIKYSKFYFALSLLILLPGIFSLIKNGLNLAIDFTGGSIAIYSIGTNDSNNVTEFIQSQYLEITQKEAIPTTLSDGNLSFRSHEIQNSQNDLIKQALLEKYPEVSQISFETIGPLVGKETTLSSFKALVIACIGILLYIAYSFKNIPKPHSSFKFGFAALVAMLHDALVVLGLFSILGFYYKVEIDALFITAILTVIGFSVHDTIVVFDRVRENLGKMKGYDFEEVVDYSLVETLNRSLATSLTVVIVLVSMFLLGGDSLKYFVLALLVGVVSGTYSSIFNAAPLLVLWEKGKKL